MASYSRPVARHYRDLERRLQAQMTLFGYELIDLPVIASAEIFLTRAGSTIIEKLFTFERYGQLLALRPEFTATAAHHYVQSRQNDPVRWQMIGRVFEDDPADVSAQTERHTIGAELIGESGPAADAEIIGMAVTGARGIGLSDYQIVSGHVGLQWHLLAQHGLDPRTIRTLLRHREAVRNAETATVKKLVGGDVEYAISDVMSSDQTQVILDALLDSTRYGSTMGGRTRHDIAARLLRKQQRGFSEAQLNAALEFLSSWSQIAGPPGAVFADVRDLIADDDRIGLGLFADWKTAINLLTDYGIAQERIIIQPDLTKNWDYYTGVVFGIRSEGSYIASGGRYDGLTQLLGSDISVPAVGFAYYLDHLAPLIPIAEEKRPMHLYSGAIGDAVRLAQTLRTAGIAALVTDSSEADCTLHDNVMTYRGQTYEDVNSLIEAMKENDA